MWRKKKVFLCGLLVLFLLSVLSLPIFSEPDMQRQIQLLKKLQANLTEQQEILIADRAEFEQDKKELKQTESALNQKEQELNDREADLNQEKIDLNEDRILLQTMREFYQSYKKTLRAEYWKGFLAGSLIGFTVGTGTGAYAGFSLGVRVQIPFP